MKQLLWAILFIFSAGMSQGEEKKVIVKKMVISSDQEKSDVNVNVEIENDELTLTIKKNGDENVFTVNLNDDKAVTALKKELDEMGVDVNLLEFTDDKGHDFQFHIAPSFNHEKRGYLGVQIQDLTDQLRDYFKVKGAGGVLISEIIKDSPADNAGLEAGDIITKVGNTRISNTQELTQAISNEKPETKVAISLIRKGREKSVTAVLGSKESTFSWFGNMENLHKKGKKTHKKMMKKFKHECTDDCDEKCQLKDQMNFDMDGIMPDGLSEMFNKNMFQYKWNNKDELENLKNEIEELRKEIEKLKDS